MEEFWARFIEPSGQTGQNYWEYFAERLAQLAIIPKDAMILDLGTYDGNVLFKAMKKMKAQAYGVGADIYYGGFRDGVPEIMQRGWEEKVSFVQMDANTLGFLPETFHNVLANFVGWDDCFDFERMKFISPDKMMSEIMRVMRPGGQVGIGSWVEQSDIDWLVDRFKKYLPEYVDRTETRMLSYGIENPQGYEIILQNSGFDNIQVHVERTTFVSPDEATWWRQMKKAASDYFEKIPDSVEIQPIKEQIFADLQQFQSPRGIRFDKTVSYAYGNKR
ncbi:MAG: class I SAM-dependent methyltransferase [Anaerolineales bacterium]